MKDNHKYLKRFLAFALSVAMVITYMPVNLIAYAETEAPEQPVAEEVVNDTASTEAPAPQEEVKTEEPAPVQEEVTETEPAPVEEPVVTEESSPAEGEQQQAEQPEEVVEETPAEETPEPEEEEAFPAQTFNADKGGVKVLVKAPEGALPEGTEMVVTPVASDDVEQALQDAVDGNVTSYKAVDITFVKDGEEVKPAKPVHVYINASGLNAADDKSVVHIDDAGNAEVVEDATVNKAGIAKVVTDQFSVYAVVGTDDGINEQETARRTYKFVLDDNSPYYFTNTAGKKVDYQIVKNGDTLVAPNPAPTKKNSDNEDGAWKFDGWYNGDTKFEFGTVSGITEDETVTLKAKFSHVYYVHYYDTKYIIDKQEIQNIMESQEVSEGADATVDSLEAVPLSTDEKFAGWTDIKDGGDVKYKAGDKISNVTKDINLYPVLEPAHWIHFYSNGDKATYTSPVQFFETQNTVKPADPTRVGYTFDGWYTDEACTQAFTWGGNIKSDVNLYAKWKGAETSYKVVVWKQSINDKKDATSKTYDFEKSYKVDANSGTTATAGDYKNLTFKGFKYSTADSDTPVKGDGSTVINVYYDRLPMTIHFINNGSEVEKFTGLYGQTLSQNGYTWPSNYRWSSTDSNQTLTFLDAFIFDNLSDYSAKRIDGANTYNDITVYRHNAATGSTITFYKEALDNSWTEANKVTTSAGYNGSTFTFTEKYTGFSVYQYNSDESGWRTANVDSSAKYYNTLEIRFKRNSYDLTFDVNGATTTAPEAKSVKYQESLQGYIPTDYIVDDTSYTDSQGKVYKFKGWYDNKDGEGNPFEFEKATMPANNVQLYAKWEEQSFKVNIDPNGGVLSGTESTWFNVKWGEKIGAYDDVRRDYVEDASGTYYYHVDKRPAEPRKAYYTENSSESTDGKKYIYEKDAYQLIGWYEDGKAYNFDTGVTKDTTLTAMWKRVGKFTVTVHYKDASGKYIDLEGLSYSDQAKAVTPTSVPYTPEGQTLTGWTLIMKDGTVRNINLGAEFTVDADTMAQRVDGKELIELEPVFKDNDKLDVTNINFNANGGTGEVAPASNLDLNGNTSADNNKVKLPSSGFTKEGYQLIGWSTQSGNNTVEYILGGEYAADGTDNTLYAVWAEKINVNVAGEVKENVVYDGNEKTNATTTAPKGYTVEASGKDTTDASDLVEVTVADTVKAPAKGTNVGEYTMGLSDSTVTAALKGETKEIKNAGTVVVKDNKYYILGDKEVTDGKLVIIANADEVTVTITENSGSEKYDGTEKTATGYTVKISNPLYKESDFTFKGNDTVKGTDAGSYPMELKPGDFTNNNANFSNVKFVIEDGTLVISKRSVTLTSADAQKVYDGQPLTNSTVTVSGDGFVSGEGATYNVTGSQTEVGNSKNTFTYSLNSGTKAANYDINTIEGTLTVTELTDKVTVTITENSGSEKYDGSEKTVTGYEVTNISNTLYKESDFTFSGSATVKGTDAGSYPMELKAADFTNNNKNFKNVEFVIVDGTLEIAKRSVTLTSADDEKVYDGTALTNDEVTVGGDGFVKGEGATYKVTGTQTDVGESKNAFTYTLNEGTKADNYTITKTEGTLTVTALTDKVTVTITEHSGSFKYDGSEKTVTGYDVSIDNELYTTDDFTFKGNATVKGTNAGSYPMELKPADFTNTSKNFTNVEFVIVDGTLEISKRTVTLTSADDEKVYDGTALTNDEVTVGGDGFAEGEGAAYDVTGTQTEVGESKNAFTYTLNEGTKADNYTITKTEGTLKVTELTDEVTVTITENSGEEKYDGSEKTVTGYTVKISNPLYTENDFTFSGNATVKGTDAGTYNMELKPADFKNTSKNFSKVTFKIVDGTLKITKRSVTLTSADDEKVYDGTALTNDEVTVGGDGFAEGEGAAYDVTGTRTEVGNTPNAFTYTLNEGTKAANYEISKTEGTLTVTPVTDKVTVTITEHKGSEKYDGTEKTVTGYDVSIDNKLYKESDFTFSGNDTVKGTDAGSYPMELKPADFTNVSKNFSNVEFKIVDGTLEIAKREVTLTSADASKVYDGKALTKDEVTVSGDGFVKGEGATYNVTGTQTEVGSSANAFSYTLNEGTKAGNYDITKTEGTLTVTALTDKVTVTITENSGSEKYDGKEKTVTGYEVTSISNPLYTDKDFTFGGDATVKGTDAGIYQMNLKPADFTNTSKNFSNVEFVIVDGTLEITKREVTLTSADDEKVYDGKALTNDKVTVGGDGFADGEGAKYDVTGTQTDVGESKNAFTYTLNEGTNKDNYTITTAEGTLTVTPVTDKVTVTITGHKDDVDYNGAEQKVEGYDVSIDNELYTDEDFTFSGDATAKGTDVKKSGDDVDSYPMGLKAGDFENISKNFTNVEFVVNDGSLKIEPIDVTIESASAKKVYDGTPLTKHAVTVDGFVEGEGLAAVKVTGTQTYVGSSENTFEYKLFGDSIFRKMLAALNIDDTDAYDPAENGVTKTTKADNYNITVKYGTLEVTDEDVPVDKVATKTHEDKEYKLGETVKFTIEVTNIYDEKKTITVEEQEGVTITSESEFKDVEPGDKVTVTAEYVVTEADLLAGSFSNTATVKFSDVEKPYEPKDDVDVEDPNSHLTVDKKTTSKPANGETYALGETITYEVTATNDGNMTLKNIEVTDELTGDAWTVEELAPGESKTFTAEYTVTEKDIIAGSVKNEATATAEPKDPEAPKPEIVPGTTEDPTDESNPHLTVVKETTSTPANGEEYEVGETVTYEITVTNDGNLTVKDIEVKDDLTGDKWNVESLAPEQSQTFNCEYTITEEDAKNGSVTNIATATGITDDPNHPYPTVVPGEKTVPVVEPADDTKKGVKTGDDNNFGGWLAMMLLAGAGASGLFIRRRREDEE